MNKKQKKLVVVLGLLVVIIVAGVLIGLQINKHNKQKAKEQEKIEEQQRQAENPAEYDGAFDEDLPKEYVPKEYDGDYLSVESGEKFIDSYNTLLSLGEPTYDITRYVNSEQRVVHADYTSDDIKVTVYGYSDNLVSAEFTNASDTLKELLNESLSMGTIKTLEEENDVIVVTF